MKVITLIFFILMLVYPASALTTLNNAIIGNHTIYYNVVVDNAYQLNVSDSLEQVDLSYSIYDYPQKVVYSFYNTDGRNLVIVETISKNPKIVGFSIDRNYKYYFDFVQLSINELGRKNISEYNESDYFVLAFDRYKHTERFVFDSDMMFDAGSSNQAINYNYRNAYIINNFKLTNASQFLSYEEIKIKYTDKTLDLEQYRIDTGYESLNPIFKFMFLIIKGVLGFANWTTAISQQDFLNYQLTALFPLEILNFLLNIVLFTINFIWKNLFISIGMIVCLTFIWSYITTNDIYEAIPKFFNTLIFIFERFIINPSIYIFEHIIKFWK